MGNDSSPIPAPGTCANCGHDRKDHQLDDSCWREIRVAGRIILCTCLGFEPISAATTKTDGQQWRDLFHDTLVERNPSMLPEKIASSERAIRQRMAEVTPSDGPEWQKLRSAVQTLKFLKSLCP